MATRKKQPGIEGIEPHRMGGLPAMDRPSLAFGWFLDRMTIEGLVNESTLILACNYCGDSICDIEDGDNLRVLLNTALAHTCT